MKVLIVEDEPRTAQDLASTLREVNSAIEVVKFTDSVESTVAYLQLHPALDLAFFDIQLADGLSFEVFKRAQVPCPVVFCTAYDQYSMDAFQSQGIEYLLKPFDEVSVGRALSKVQALAKFFRQEAAPDLQKLMSAVEKLQPSEKTAFLVSYQGKYLPITVSDIAFFTIYGEVTWLYTRKGEKFHVSHTLEEVENMVGHRSFYRANRQYIIHFDCVTQVENDVARKLAVKLSVKTPEPVIVSKAKATDFLRWMNER